MHIASLCFDNIGEMMCWYVFRKLKGEPQILRQQPTRRSVAKGRLKLNDAAQQTAVVSAQAAAPCLPLHADITVAAQAISDASAPTAATQGAPLENQASTSDEDTCCTSDSQA